VAAGELAADQAHIWVVRPEEVARLGLVRRYESLLTPEELARGKQFRVQSSRLEHLAARVLVRTVLSKYVDVAPGDWRFGAQPLGRPEVTYPKLAATPRFNLSHTRGLVVCLVARDRDVGVDVEDTSRAVGFQSIAERYFSAHERADIRSLSEADGRIRFFQYWTLKESIIKALGTRIAFGLSRFRFELTKDSIRVRFDEPIAEDPEAWQFALREIGTEHLLAASLRTAGGVPLRIDLREILPLSP